MPEKQEKLHQFNPAESVVMTSGQQAQKMVEEAKKTVLAQSRRGKPDCHLCSKI